MPGAKWLEMLLQHVPDRGEHLVRYYGWYSNRARGTRKAEIADPEPVESVIEEIPEQVDPEASRAAPCTTASRTGRSSRGYHGVARSVPCWGALNVRGLDRQLEALPARAGTFYVRYMDDVLILATTRWKLRRGIWFRTAKVVAHGREAPFPGCSLPLRLRRLKANSYPSP
jgi:hypothetical protein